MSLASALSLSPIQCYTQKEKENLSLSSWSNDKLCQAGFLESPKCELCGDPNQTMMHLLHHCSALKEARQLAQAHIPQINIADLPQPLQVGIPLPIMCNCQDTFWGSDWSQLVNPSELLGCFRIPAHKVVQDQIEAIRASATAWICGCPPIAGTGLNGFKK